MSPIENLIIGLVAGGVVAGLLFFFTGRKRREDPEMFQRLELLDRTQERMERMLRDELPRNRSELAENMKSANDTTIKSIAEISAMLKGQLEGVTMQTGKLTESNEARLEGLRSIVDLRLKQLQEDNSKQLDRMRATVDEKLQGTLEKRLGESFKLVSDRLEQVHQGLGAMQQLASDVGGLQKVLTNVKMRGGWGEVQLGALLEQILTADQFARNVKTREDSGERVEFAIKLPGDENGAPVWLPIDAKFPTEDYQRLVAAQELGDLVAVDDAMKSLEMQLRRSAKEI
jgi:DNA recombination protein RmuC